MFRTLPPVDDPRIGIASTLLNVEQQGLPMNLLRPGKLPPPSALPQVPPQEQGQPMAPWLTPLAMAALNLPPLAWPWSPLMPDCNEWIQKHFPPALDNGLPTRRAISMLPPPQGVLGSRLPNPVIYPNPRRKMSFPDDMDAVCLTRAPIKTAVPRSGASAGPRRIRCPAKRSFTETTSSPVSGTIIRQVPRNPANKGQNNDSSKSGTNGHSDQEAADPNSSSCKTVLKGDIESSLNCVEVTPEARAELAKIENRLGDYVCRLCHDKFEDAFQLAQHRCPCIVHIEYRCLQCDKVFHCPANLASHQRWHKPKPQSPVTSPSVFKPAKHFNDNSALGVDSDEVVGKKVLKMGLKTTATINNNNYDDKVETAYSSDQNSDESSQGSSGSIDTSNSAQTPKVNSNPHPGAFTVAALLGMPDHILT